MTDKRPIHETENGGSRLKCVKSNVKVLYGVNALQNAVRYKDEKTGDTFLTDFGEKYHVSGDTASERVRKAVETADVIPELVAERLDELEVDY